MTFADKYESGQVREWILKYIDYKGLKNLLKKRRGKCSVLSSEGSQEFFNALEAEVGKASDFYLSRETDALERKRKIVEQIQILPFKEATEKEDGVVRKPETGKWTRKEWNELINKFDTSVNESVSTLKGQKRGDSPRSAMDIVKPVEKAQAPIPTSKAAFESLRKAAPSKEARAKIERALMEFYRSVNLLRRFLDDNVVAVEKILRKYEYVTMPMEQTEGIELEACLQEAPKAFSQGLLKHKMWSSTMLEKMLADV